MKRLFQNFMGYFAIVSSLFVFSNSQAEAAIPPGSGCFAVDVEFIYFHPHLDDPIYVMENTVSIATTVAGDRRANPLSYDPGFRIEGLVTICECVDDIGVRWTRHHSHNNDTTTGPLLSLDEIFTGIFPGFVTNRIRIDYDAVDVLYRRSIICDCPFNLAVGAGLHYAHLRLEDRTVTSTAVVVDHNFRSHGIGPQLYAQGEYRLPFACFPLSIVASGRAALLAQRHHSSLEVFTAALPTIRDDDERIWRVVPFFDIRVGLSYAFCVCRFPVYLEVGYEFLDYIRAVYKVGTFSIFTQGAIYTDVSFYGPYVNLGLVF